MLPLQHLLATLQHNRFSYDAAAPNIDNLVLVFFSDHFDSGARLVIGLYLMVMGTTKVCFMHFDKFWKVFPGGGITFHRSVFLLLIVCNIG